MKNLRLNDFIFRFISYIQEIKIYEWDNEHEEDELIFSGTPNDIEIDEEWPSKYIVDYVDPKDSELYIYITKVD